MSAVPDPQQSPAQEILAHFKSLEKLSLNDLVFNQARKLERLVRHAAAHVPFYRNRLNAVFNDKDYFDASRWYEVPILTRQEAQENIARLKAEMIPAHAGNGVDDRTSGSGGSPLYFLRSTAALMADAGNSLRLYHDHKLDFAARFADIRIDLDGTAQYPDGAIYPDWSFGEGDGDYVQLDINTPTEQQIEWLLRRRPKILFTWATNASRIALELERLGETLDLSTIATGAEACTAGVRKDCRRVFGCEPVDILGIRELGIVAFPCNKAPCHHLTAESKFIEVVKDDGTPAKPGEAGQLVGTDLYNFHMPFIRYATGDYVSLVDKPCVCGRSLPAIAAILGRGRNRYRNRSGGLVFPQIPETLLDDLLGPLPWWLVQKGLGELELRIENSDRIDQTGVVPKITEACARGFGEPVRLTLVEIAPDQQSGRKKRELFVSEII